MFWESPPPSSWGISSPCSCVESSTSKIHIFDFFGLLPFFLECIPYSFPSKGSRDVCLLRTCMSSNMFILLCHSSSSVAGPFLDLASAPLFTLLLLPEYYLLPFHLPKSLPIFKVKSTWHLLQEALPTSSVLGDCFSSIPYDTYLHYSFDI